MERHRSPSSSAAACRLLRLISSPSPPQSLSPSFELNESDLFDPSLSPIPTPNPNPNPNSDSNPNPVVFSRRSSFPRPPEGMLAVLPEGREGTRGNTSEGSSPSSSSCSPSSAAARLIPPIPKPKQEFTQAHHPQSAPVNVPLKPPSRFKSPNQESIFLAEEQNSSKSDPKSEGEGEGEFLARSPEILPPHEFIARSRARESPLTTFSVMEGAGRTLKGRDLRQVRNAVWRRTGFLD